MSLICKVTFMNLEQSQQPEQVNFNFFYDTKTVAKAAGIPYRTLIRWISGEGYELLNPAKRAGGKGYRHYFNDKQLREVVTFAALRKVVSLQKLRTIRNELIELGHNPFSAGTFLALDVSESKVEIYKVHKGEILPLLEKKNVNPDQIRLFPLEELEIRLENAHPVLVNEVK